ncbi:hypothetical protein MOO46_07550 (plasmid) [Apilactobacillus apisilvae]|uniref:Morphogenesis protein n=1 Tax=Apilactobacillus apisilvae TaxID=2923364 RepID=A0ABY4PK30_9LACO|nr:hypothetical protein [Apilactobacillus apisilvae]UQS85779.1 hypothetical protein MOO46_07550 [Apilactobacillus apisilvae]
MSSDINHLKNAKPALTELNAMRVIAGVPANNDHLNMIALVQETGKHIEHKNYPYLVIPTGNAEGRKASQIVGLYKRGKALGIDDASQPNGFKVMFVLRESVNIPARPFMTYTRDHYGKEWQKTLADCTFKLLLEQMTVHEVCEALGKQMVEDLKTTLRQFKEPKNAPLTEERKGFNNPLIDNKGLLNSIDYFVVKNK